MPQPTIKGKPTKTFLCMNIDAAQQCLDKSKQKFQRGDSEAALRFAKKALALHSEFEEARIWVSTVGEADGH